MDELRMAAATTGVATKKIRALLAEASPDDVERVVHELEQSGYDCEWKRVDNAEAFRDAMNRETWDVILADFSMPRFSAAVALDILKSSGKDIPFIIMSGSLGEPIAVEAMNAGATDLVPEPNITRLGQAIEREMREAKVRHERQQAVTDVTRITSGQLVLHREKLDLGDLVASVIARMHDAIDRSGCHVAIRAERAVAGMWDRVRMELAVASLLSNATKYGSGKRVDVDIDSDPTKARLRIHDRGIGISKDWQARIFERFERAVPEQHYGGLGLGLWIVRQVVEAHGGTVRVDSKPNEGSTFTVELPIEEGARR
jgi:signal transduction histidine kinase